MSSLHDCECAVYYATVGYTELLERDYDSTTPRGRRVMPCQHERLQSLLKSRSLRSHSPLLQSEENL